MQARVPPSRGIMLAFPLNYPTPTSKTLPSVALLHTPESTTEQVEGGELCDFCYTLVLGNTLLQVKCSIGSLQSLSYCYLYCMLHSYAESESATYQQCIASSHSNWEWDPPPNVVDIVPTLLRCIRVVE